MTLFWRAVTLHHDGSQQRWRGPPREQHRPTVTPCLTINEVMMGDVSQVPPGHLKASRRHIKAALPQTAEERWRGRTDGSQQAKQRITQQEVGAHGHRRTIVLEIKKRQAVLECARREPKLRRRCCCCGRQRIRPGFYRLPHGSIKASDPVLPLHFTDNLYNPPSPPPKKKKKSEFIRNDVIFRLRPLPPAGRGAKLTC